MPGTTPERLHIIWTLGFYFIFFYEAPGEAKHSPHTSLDSASCQLEQNKWWESWGNRIDASVQDVLFSSVFVLPDYQANTHCGNSRPALLWFSMATASPALMPEGMTSKSLVLSAQLAEHNYGQFCKLNSFHKSNCSVVLKLLRPES